MNKLIFVIVFWIGSFLLVTPLYSDCLGDGGVFRQSLNCTGLPTIDKYYDPTTFSWGSNKYLAINSGNDLELWNINNPQAPIRGSKSNFRVGNQGDSNHDLINYSICDDCRYGIASFHLGNVLFDLGSGAVPSFGAKHIYSSTNPKGGFIFKFKGEQYLLGKKLPNDCGGEATLYHYSNVTTIEPIGCVNIPGVTGDILNGVQVEGYLYLGFTDYRVYIFEVVEGGSAINLDYTGSSFRAFLGRAKGLSVDHDAHLAATAYFYEGLRIYDISNPANPVQRSFVPGTLSLAAINFPFVWAARAGYNDSLRTFNISNTTQPIELDQEFWDPSHPWNSHGVECEWPNGAVFSSDATTMYLARHAVVQSIDFTECLSVDAIFADGFESGDTGAWEVKHE
jgi:hypothetical protein